METAILPERVREARTAKGLSQAALGKLLGKTQQAILAVEKGRVRDAGFVVELAHALGVSPQWLRGHTDNPAPDQMSAERRELLNIIERADPEALAYILGLLRSLDRKGAA